MMLRRSTADFRSMFSPLLSRAAYCAGGSFSVGVFHGRYLARKP